LFYVGGSYGRRRVCYVRNKETDLHKTKFVKRNTFAPEFMVLAGVSCFGKTSLIFKNKGVKVNAKYYKDELFLKKDVPQFFRGRMSQDSFSTNAK
jgi:hypothetical protein